MLELFLRELGMGNVIRKEHIEKKWYFRCECPLCQDPTEHGTFLR